jgi:predicted nucleotidyltransferase
MVPDDTVYLQPVMQITPYTDINELLDSLLSQIQTILNQKLVGVYLYGSLVWGDFDYESSDIDLLAATSSDIDDKEFNDLQQMHCDFVDAHKRWDDRIEIAYISIAALQTFKSRTSELAIISPGESFHRKEAGKDWLINWYMVQEKGLTLFGPAPQILIDTISKEEFIHAVQKQAKEWESWIYSMHTRKAQAYAILTMCRALYAYKNGEQVSKRQAALWAEKQLPQWSSLIKNALLWREAWRDETVDHNATFPETLRFVQFIIAQIV